MNPRARALPGARSPRWPPPERPQDPAGLSRLAVEVAGRHGFAAAGVLRAEEPETWSVFRAWLDGGHHGGMAWLERDAEARRRFDAILPYCRSILSVAMAIDPGPPGNVARYARGEDYHRVVRRRLHAVAAELRPAVPKGTHFRVCVDTAPLLEREIAVRAGLGFLGKNGLLIVPELGSHVVLGELLTDAELASTVEPADSPFDRCGTCIACLDDCPTNAFLAPRLLDARRCLSYLTIEARGDFTPGQESSLSGQLFGCDICQDVCPWNARPRGTGPHAPAASLDPAEIAELTQEMFEARFGDTALSRATLQGLVRNARAALARRPRVAAP